MFLGYSFLVYTHIINQNYHNKYLNQFFSGIWISMAIQSFVYVIFTLITVKPFYPIFFGILIIGFIFGWIINIYFNKWYTKKIFNNIRKKFNRQHIIQKIKEQSENENIDENEEKSLETIVSEKKM
ncbi:hypothetical protein BCR32DRAFT_268315, partial [Anaeromyces robustus]